MKPSCCGLESVWVDNVPGKEYYFCTECREEVPEIIETVFTPTNTILSDDEIAEFWRMLP
jgi:hypothetical protein